MEKHEGFNDAMKQALETGIYICDQCGGVMEFEDENEDILVCPTCGNSMDLDHYGYTDDEYEELYSIDDDFDDDNDDFDEDDTGEYYEEEYDELSHHLED